MNTAANHRPLSKAAVKRGLESIHPSAIQLSPPFSALQSGQWLFQRSSPQKQIPCRQPKGDPGRAIRRGIFAQWLDGLGLGTCDQDQRTRHHGNLAGR